MGEQRSSLKSELNFLERLSIEELEALLKLSGNPNDVEELFDAVVEEVVAREEKKPTGRLPDVDAAWDELQTMYHNAMEWEPLQIGKDAGSDVLPDEPPNKEDKHRRISLRRVTRVAAIMAASMVLLLALLVAAQAAGTNVFGALAQWTDDAFWFVPSSESQSNPIKRIFQQHGIPEEIAPTWIPEGFELYESVFQRNDERDMLAIKYGNEDKTLIFEVSKYRVSNAEAGLIYEKDPNLVEKFVSFGREFYIFSNLNTVTATWSGEKSLAIDISGNISMDELKQIINSIGGQI